MNFKEYADTVIKEIEQSISSIDSSHIDHLVNIIVSSNRIFCDGMGKSGFQANSFAMRLAQMGMKSYAVADVTTPAIKKDDLLIICSGSGETVVLKEHAKTARLIGAKILAVTANKNSTIGKIADYVVEIAAPIKGQRISSSIQPMGSLFEQATGLFFDILVLVLMEKQSVTDEEMYKKHKNLE